MKRVLDRLMRAAAFVLVLAGATAQAQTQSAPAAAQMLCPDAKILGAGLTSSICWRCLYPIRIGPALIGGTGLTLPDVRAPTPCTCPGRILGYPTPGVPMGMPMPTRLIEMVRAPYCSPALGKTIASPTHQALAGANWGKLESGGRGEQDASSYYNFHYWAFPVGVILRRFQESVCASQSGAVDFDLLWMSELSPLWSNDQLAFYVNPESALFANPAAQAACMADAVASSTHKPIDALFWCLGSWGTIAPMSGHSPTSGSAPREASLLAGRGMAQLHRLGLSNLTYGPTAVCRWHPYPTLPKQQYRLQTMFPAPELISNHWLGASTFRWGEWRNVPAPAVDSQYLFLSWQYSECCVNF